MQNTQLNIAAVTYVRIVDSLYSTYTCISSSSKKDGERPNVPNIRME